MQLHTGLVLRESAANPPNICCRALHITAAREATDAQCLLPVCSEDREQVAQPFAGTSATHPAVALCGKVPLVVQHRVVAKIQCP